MPEHPLIFFLVRVLLPTALVFAFAFGAFRAVHRGMGDPVCDPRVTWCE